MLIIKTKGILDKVQVSQNRQAHIKTFHDIPDKFKDRNRYKQVFDSKKRCLMIYDKTKEEYIIDNPRSAGTPLYVPINSQKVYSGVHFSVRKKIVDELHRWYEKFIRDQTKRWNGFRKDEFPLKLEVQFLKYSRTKCADIDNLSYIYIKCFLDTLREMNKLPEDNPDYLRKFSSEIIFVTNPGNEMIDFRLSPYLQTKT